MRWRQKPVVVYLTLVAFGLAGCAETKFVTGSMKELSGGPPQSQPTYKIGTPYEINGVAYFPQVDYGYSETGVASWYGPDFHNRQTANGEIFDMNEISAAHRTLPMPSLVRVTNLENGRTLNVRVNDRGPFARGRIIDLSRRAAQLLGFEGKGTALVRVDILPDESRRLAAELGAPVQVAEAGSTPQAAPRTTVTAETLAPPPGNRSVPPSSASRDVSATELPPAAAPRPLPTPATAPAQVDGRVQQVTVSSPPTVYVQAGAFSQYDNAHRVRALLGGIGPTTITQVDHGTARFFRVRLGPIGTVEEADLVLARVASSGFPEAQIVID